MSDQKQRPITSPVEEKDDEARVFSIRNFAIVTSAVIVMILLVVGIAAIFLQFFMPGKPQTASQPPEPRLQVNPSEDIQSLRATADAQLNSAGWVNQEAGIAHIPIQRAMQIIAQEGEAAAMTTTGGTPQPAASPEEAGQRVFEQLGCSGCHTDTTTNVAPTLHGLFGEQVTLTSGETVTADEAYLRESILQPQAQIVEGYQPIMPSFEGRLSDSQLSDLIAYIQSLSNP
jgi:cytochrome c2